MNALLIGLLYQALWFALVIGASRGHTAIPLVGAAVLVVARLVATRRRRQRAARAIAAVLLGIVIEGVPAFLSWCAYASPEPAVPVGGAPVWLLAIWAAFAVTLDAWEHLVRRHWWIAALLGAIGGPLAYAGAARTFDVIVFPQASPGLAGMIAWWATCWAIALPLLLAVGTRGPAASSEDPD